MARIKPEDNYYAAIKSMAGNSESANAVLLELLNHSFAYLVRLDHLCIYEDRIYTIYKHRYGENLQSMMDGIDNAIGILNIKKVHHVK